MRIASTYCNFNGSQTPLSLSNCITGLNLVVVSFSLVELSTCSLLEDSGIDGTERENGL